MGNLKIYQQDQSCADQSCAQAFLLTAGITASSDSRSPFHPILVTDKLQCSLPKHESNVSKVKYHLLLQYDLLPDYVNHAENHATAFISFVFSVLSHVTGEVWSIILPILFFLRSPAGFTACFHSTDTLRKIHYHLCVYLMNFSSYCDAINDGTICVGTHLRPQRINDPLEGRYLPRIDSESTSDSHLQLHQKYSLKIGMPNFYGLF